jgi:hypothetical protein
MKKTKSIMVDINKIRLDRTFQRIWKTSRNAALFIKAVKDHGHYTNPVVYKKESYYYLLGHKPGLDALIELGQEEVQVDLIEIDTTFITPFLIVFLSKEHKEPRVMAEYVRVILEYAATPEGKKWYKTTSDTEDKEDRLASLLDVSSYSVKCYLRLLQPGNEKYLEMLSDLKNYSLSGLYKECLNAEKQSRDTAAGFDEDEADDMPTNTLISSTKVPSSSDKPVETNPIHTSVGASMPVTNQTGTPEKAGEDLNLEEVFLRYLDKYKFKKEGAENIPGHSSENFIRKVVIFFEDGTRLELSGKVVFAADGGLINSTAELAKMPDGNWKLAKPRETIALTIHSDSKLVDFPVNELQERKAA